MAIKSLHAPMETLQLHHLRLVYPGAHEYRVREHMTVFPLRHLGELPMRWDQKAASPPE